ncbi:hypothetical protein CRYUN_Cryun19dG0080400 [Craigia yunnanensis]
MNMMLMNLALASGFVDLRAMVHILAGAAPCSDDLGFASRLLSWGSSNPSALRQLHQDVTKCLSDAGFSWISIICWSGRGGKSTKESRVLSDLLCAISHQGCDIFSFTYGVLYISIASCMTAEDKGKGSSSTCTKPIAECLEEEVRDARIKVFGSMKQDTDEDCSERKILAQSLKSEYPKYTPLLVKILESLLSRSNIGDKIHHYEEKKKKKMETTCDQLAEVLCQKGLALAEIEYIKGENASALAAIEGTKDVHQTGDQSAVGSDIQSDLFENFKELKKWVDLKSSKSGTLSVLRERRCGRLGTALKALNDMIQDHGEPPKKKLYELKLTLLDDIGWIHLSTYERQWMHVRFPPSLPLF